MQRRLSLLNLMHEVTARQGPRTGSFELNKEQIRKISKNLVSLITRKYYENFKANYKAPVEIASPINGKKEEIFIEINPVLNQSEFRRGPIAQWDDVNKTVHIRVPDQFLWFNKPPDEWRAQIEQALIHELTHAFDIKGNVAWRAGKAQASGKTKKDREKYFLDPAEVKAYLAQTTEEMQHLITRFPGIKRPEDLLDQTNTWTALAKYYTKYPRIYKMFLTAAFYVFQNAKA